MFAVSGDVDGFAGVDRFREAKEGDHECSELDVTLVILSLGSFLNMGSDGRFLLTGIVKHHLQLKFCAINPPMRGAK